MEVDGKPIVLNEFTQRIIGNLTLAIADSLRGVAPGEKEIAIKLYRD